MLERPISKAGWTRVAFGDVVRLSKARVADPEAAGFERVVGLEHIDPGDLRIRRWADIGDGTTFTTVFKPGQVLFGKRRAYQRKVAVADFEGVCSGDIYVLEPANDRLMPELLPFLCQTDAFFDHAVGTSAGSLSPRTNWTSLASFEFMLPPIQEQARLVDVLSSMQMAIEALNVAGSTAGTAYFSAAASFIDKAPRAISTLEMNGSGFAFDHVRSLFELTEKISDGEHLSPEFTETGVALLSAKDVLEEGISFSGARYISERAAERSWQRCDPRRDDVLIVSRGATIGRASIVDNETPFALMGSVIQVRVNLSKLLPKFLLHFLRQPETRRNLLATSGNSAQQAIYLEDIRSLKIFAPPLDHQRSICVKLDALIDASKHTAERENFLLRLQKQIIASMSGGGQ